MPLIDQVLERLDLRSTVFSRMTLAGDWGFAKHELKGAPFHLVLSGQAYVGIPNNGGIHRLGAGDLAILPCGDAHLLLSRPDASALPWRRMREQQGWGPWHPGQRFKAVDLRHGSGEPRTRMISGVFGFGDDRRNQLLDALPRLMVTSGEGDSAGARSTAAIAALLDTEIASERPGAENIASRLADILFVYAVRHQLLSATSLPQGWLRAIADRELAPAIGLMHGKPEQAWSVETLAQALGMSRSRFAARFRDSVGKAPLEYLTEWRMYQAAGQLAADGMAIPLVAASVGYRSDVAFSKAFKRWAGQSPAAYRREHRERRAHPGTTAPDDSDDHAMRDDRL